KDRKTPYGSKYQKTHAGVSANQGGGDRGDEPPNLRNVKTQDFFHLGRCEVLYWQAVEAGIVVHSECSALNFLAAAVRARSIEQGDPARVFMAIIRRKLWSYITSEQEDVAHAALSRIRQTDSLRFRTPEKLLESGERILAA